MSSSPRPGVLALQGDFEPHARVLSGLGHAPREVRSPAELAGLTHLVLPGGESTTLAHLLALFGLDEAIRRAHREDGLVLFGTCAGAILLGHRPAGDDARPPRLGLADVDVTRNAYGRQVHSAERELAFADGRRGTGTFIRAPRFTRVGSGLDVLAHTVDDDAPVLVEGPGFLLATYHPELGRDDGTHRRFLALQPASGAALA